MAASKSSKRKLRSDSNSTAASAATDSSSKEDASSSASSQPETSPKTSSTNGRCWFISGANFTYNLKDSHRRNICYSAIGRTLSNIDNSKLVPTLVSRALPPSSEHHRMRVMRSIDTSNAQYSGGDEEEMHQAISDSSLSVTDTSFGLFGCIPISSREENWKEESLGHVDMINLGKRRMAMTGEKEGKWKIRSSSNSCARDDVVKTNKKDNAGVDVVGNDSDDESDDESDLAGESNAVTSSSSSSDSSEDDESLLQ
ncbi:hypothetical protein QTG54_014559 [Skeletonema marinoi]|uniref:Uncharacterized protein n=1 Tax=Skeletonema marinoi TaxID=267567 RepID=A0AAD8XWN3_9STRA|nr:hypothetical protein QTG54_014559 [Skeletonema marinoi]